MDTRKPWDGYSGVFMPPWWKKMMKEKYGIECDKPWTGISEVYMAPWLLKVAEERQKKLAEKEEKAEKTEKTEKEEELMKNPNN